MKKFSVHLELLGHKWVQVEADTIQEAKELAFNIGLELDMKEFSSDTEVMVVDAVEDQA
jgi:hypothetical protein